MNRSDGVPAAQSGRLLLLPGTGMAGQWWGRWADCSHTHNGIPQDRLDIQYQALGRRMPHRGCHLRSEQHLPARSPAVRQRLLMELLRTRDTTIRHYGCQGPAETSIQTIRLPGRRGGQLALGAGESTGSVPRLLTAGPATGTAGKWRCRADGDPKSRHPTTAETGCCRPVLCRRVPACRACSQSCARL